MCIIKQGDKNDANGLSVIFSTKKHRTFLPSATTLNTDTLLDGINKDRKNMAGNLLTNLNHPKRT